jgi:glycosyltransferase involved in cell wall biosynthesis
MTARGSLRVVQLVNSTEYGGVEEHVRELSLGLVRRGDHVTIVCPPTTTADRLAASAKGLGLDARRAELTSGGRGPLAALCGLRELLRQTSPDVLHVHLPGYAGGRLAVLAGRWAGVGAIICTSHLAPGGRVSGRARAERVLLNLCVNRFIAVSQDSLDRQVRHLGQPRGRSAVVRNGVDLARFAPAANHAAARGSLGLPLDAPVVGTVGRLAPQKATRTLVEAFPAILAAQPDAHALVVGDGPLLDEIRDLAHRLGVSERVHLVGFRTDVPLCMAAMDIFVLPSLYEGLPISILEAMSSALPVIATSVDGVPEAVVDGETGLLIPVEQPARLAAAVVELLSDPERAHAMGVAGHVHVLSRFGMDRFVDSIRAEYGIALGAAPRARRPGAESQEGRVHSQIAEDRNPESLSATP